MNWSEGFGEDNIPPNWPKQLKAFCFKKLTDDLPFKFFINPKKIICAQLNNIHTNETHIVDIINSYPSTGILMVDFVSYEREFLKNLTIVLDNVFKTLKDTKYYKIETLLSAPMQAIRNSHMNLLSKIHNLMKNPSDDFLAVFTDSLCSDKKLLQDHTNYMNKFFDVESLVTSYSVEYSNNFREQFGCMTLAQIMRSPIPWQIYAAKFAQQLSGYVANKRPDIAKKLDDFEAQTSKMTDAIDCIPKLEAISRMMIMEPFPIVVGGRRILKQGTAFKHCRSSITQREIFLFSDMFMYAQSNYGKLRAPANYSLTKMRIDILSADKPCIAIYAPKKSFVLQFNSPEELASWEMALKKAIENAKAAVDSQETYREAPIWISDTAADKCMECSKPFNALTRRRHHCRVCGRVLCAECVSKKIIIENIDEKKPEKVCDKCYDLLSKSKK
ncbi:FYVE zinc finger family protein [Trichomonas vaginalis G3]|uniref:FYVE zinc finger family protein n=1 Tax=Trichomonas vaginalis (strain ATCC PRA-98 / G3) TaxID=412133 RepID=A2F5J3_TRIV3|nr:lipid binding [Trichomonas vaginalis G3]EAX99819.1 FYVE zinc finger family protein [Trichomonas vaginalis G3]KAI5517814.1 lipid binding [Trichomonas vaginalis G3]|eukprot:XP_001312749.1 FYVE zinc finger family protein [Trichomonas vaginalis G3]